MGAMSDLDTQIRDIQDRMTHINQLMMHHGISNERFWELRNEHADLADQLDNLFDTLGD